MIPPRSPRLAAEGAPRRLFLVRHAEAERAPGQRPTDLFSVADLPLGARGRAQAIAVAEALRDEPLDAVFASPAQRARETAQAIADAHGLPLRLDADLAEFTFARGVVDYDTLLSRIVALAGALAKEDDPDLGAGRRYLAERARFSAAIDRAAAAGRTVAVVAHGIANRAWLGALLGMPPQALFRLGQDHACVNVVDFAADRPTIAGLNLAVPSHDAG